MGPTLFRLKWYKLLYTKLLKNLASSDKIEQIIC